MWIQVDLWVCDCSHYFGSSHTPDLANEILKDFRPGRAGVIKGSRDECPNCKTLGRGVVHKKRASFWLNTKTGSLQGADEAEVSSIESDLPVVPIAEDNDQTMTAINPITKPVASGEICRDCGGMMTRTGSCMTCQSCGSNTGCG